MYKHRNALRVFTAVPAAGRTRIKTACVTLLIDDPQRYYDGVLTTKPTISMYVPTIRYTYIICRLHQAKVLDDGSC